MATVDDIDEALRGADLVTLLHCVSLYPCPLDQANLSAITTMREFYNWDGVEVGYSDHTVGTLAPVIAAALGSMVIEKHIKLSGTNPVDNAVSVDPPKFAGMVKEIRAVTLALGDGVKHPSSAEFEVSRRLRKGADGLRGAA
jgi:sialic acid synthase SpsE